LPRALRRVNTFMCGVTPGELWAGPDLKDEYAFFHLTRMQQALERPTDDNFAAIVASGAIVDSGWQRKVGPYLDAFLSAARSIPEIIECCFGRDTGGPSDMRRWFDALSADEQARRQEFRRQFAASRDLFAVLPLTKNRNTSVHRRGYPQYEIRIAGRFGVTHEGGPTKGMPLSETPTITDPYFPPALARAAPIEPQYTDFTIDGKPLFDTCFEYLQRAGALIAEGRKIAARVHGTNSLTPPPVA